MSELFLKTGVIFLGLLVIFIAWINISANLIKNHNNNYKLKINNQIIKVEVVDTFSQRAKGLSSRKNIPEDFGMFFVYKKPGEYSFWMKDMNFPIDIIWVKEDFYIADINKNIDPASFPAKFKPNQPIKYVLEVQAGFCDKNKIQINDLIEKMF
ncbi:DUF192 domain-containing protein [Patescibacteria group bacterium]|nr:DUF192 domain-containing protein [Patescibacteria group bacterium]